MATNCSANHDKIQAHLMKTKKFSIYDVTELDSNGSVDFNPMKLSPFTVVGTGNNTSSISETREKLKKFGCCSRMGALSKFQLKSLRECLRPALQYLTCRYDFYEDEFQDVDFDKFGIVRLPRIGVGKHNVHFDPHESEIHLAIETALTQMNIPETLRCNLRETGFSITRPRFNKDGVEFPVSGEMEYHSDGAAGEFTVLLAVDEITTDMGSLNIILGSHNEYVEGIGHGELKKDELDRRKVEHVYADATPLLFDARLIHGVNGNLSGKWRVLIWNIFDSY